MKELIHDFFHFMLVSVLAYSKRHEMADYAGKHSDRFKHFRAKRRNKRKVSIKLK